MVRIVTDTASDITLAQAHKMGVELVPLDITFEGAAYSALKDDTFEEFYRLLEVCDKLPVTSQPSPEQYLSIFEEAKQAGDTVVVITLSSGLSGTYQSACIAKQLSEYEEVYVLDSRSAVMGQRLLVEYAVRLRNKGKKAGEIYETLVGAVGRVTLFASLDTLKYLRKGGRIPKTAEVVGSVLNIKPIITLDKTGKVEMAGKARGHAGCMTSLIKLMEQAGEIDPVAPLYLGYTKDPLPCKKFQQLATSHFSLGEVAVRRYPVGATVGTHVGPGAVAIVYLAKEK